MIFFKVKKPVKEIVKNDPIKKPNQGYSDGGSAEEVEKPSYSDGGSVSDPSWFGYDNR